MRAKHLLLSLDDSHLPPGLLSGAVFVLGVHVAVLMTMHSVLERLLSAALAAGTSGAASSSFGLAPEGSFIMLVATATPTPSRLATAPAGARTILLPNQTAVRLLLFGAVGHTEAGAVSRPLTPPNAVMAANTAQEWITNIEVVRGKIKVTHVDVPFSERARNGGQTVESTIFTLTLNLDRVDGRTRLRWFPPHDSLLAEALARRNDHSVHHRRYI